MNLPLLFRLKGKSALVVGLGKTGKRRAEALSAYGCKVIGADPNARDLPKDIEYVATSYQSSLLEGMTIVIAATNDAKVNRSILADCNARGILCNVVDAPEQSDFIFPSVIRRGDLSIAVCTEGASPFLTKTIKQELEALYDESYAERTELLKKLRASALRNMTSEEKRIYLKKISSASIETLREEVERL